MNPKIDKQVVLNEYRELSKLPEEHKKHIWLNETTWINRFELAHSLINWNSINTWMDVGCGTARFFEEVLKKESLKNFKLLLGVDALDEFINYATSKKWPVNSSVKFIKSDIEELSENVESTFDLVTIIGAIYHCGVDPKISINQLVNKLSSGGQLFITTLNTTYHTFSASPNGIYPSIENFISEFKKQNKNLTWEYFYANPLTKELVKSKDCKNTENFKEIYILIKHD